MFYKDYNLLIYPKAALIKVEAIESNNNTSFSKSSSLSNKSDNLKNIYDSVPPFR